MNTSKELIPIIIIEGPTAAGKSKLALELATAYDTEIISADSRQVYKYLDIGTAKPAKAELETIPHHLIDIITPDQSYNAGKFKQDALEIIQKLHLRGKIPIVCGGTGLYIKALLEGLFEYPVHTVHPVHDVHIRKKLADDLESRGLAALYGDLQQIDPIAAANISSNDKQRIMRALEVYQSTGKPISVHWQEQSRQSILQPFRIMVDADRKALYDRINLRVEKMLQAGLPEEIVSIQQMGYSWNDPGFNSVGYKEFRPYQEGTESLAECVEKAQQHTRNYAKRQFTWYKKCIFNLVLSGIDISISSVRDKIKEIIVV